MGTNHGEIKMLSLLDVKYFKLAITSSKIKSESSNEIVCRCPVCGDSKKSHSKARLHLYEKNNLTFVNCFNGDCPVHNKTVYTFLRDFYPNLLSDYIREKRIKNLQFLNEIDINEIKPFEKPKDLITQDLSYLFEDIELHSNAVNYIKSRNVKYEKQFGQWFYANINLNIGGKNHNLSDSIVIPLYTPKYEMYGFYSRSIKYKHFSTYINEKNSGYKIWNWFFINKNEPVYIFEGIFDAITAINAGLKNSIACMGAMLPDDKLKELKHPILCLDNDKTGLNNTLKLVQKYNLDAFIMPDDYNVKDLNEFKNKYFNIDIKNLIKNNTFSGIYTIIVLRNRL